MNTSIVRPIKLAHVVMRTSSLEEMIDFYQELTGAEIVHRNDRIAFLSFDEEHHRIALMQLPGLLPKLRFAKGVDHFAFTFASLDDLLATYKRMKAYGVKPSWSTHHGGTVSIYYRDPDGNHIETQIDYFPTIEATNEYLLTEDFITNPVGVDFDPDDWIRRLETGEPEEEVSRRIPEGPRHPATIPRAQQGNINWLLTNLLKRLGVTPEART